MNFRKLTNVWFYMILSITAIISFTVSIIFYYQIVKDVGLIRESIFTFLFIGLILLSFAKITLELGDKEKSK